MKKKIIAILSSISLIIVLAFLASAPVTMTGCAILSNITTNQQTIAQIGADVKLGATDGTELALQKDPASRVYFASAAATLQQLISSNTVVDPNTLATNLEKLPLSQLQTPEAQLALTTIVGVYDIYYQQSVSSGISQSLLAETILTNLEVGINAGLAAVPAPAAPEGFYLPSPESFGIDLEPVKH